MALETTFDHWKVVNSWGKVVPLKNLTSKRKERKFPSRSPFARKWRHRNHPHPTLLSANRGLVDSTSRCLGIPRQPSRGAQLATEGVASEMANMTSLTPAVLQKWCILCSRIALSVRSVQSSTRILVRISLIYSRFTSRNDFQFFDSRRETQHGIKKFWFSSRSTRLKEKNSRSRLEKR